jgi:uncharacterized protein (DUF2237 family)
VRKRKRRTVGQLHHRTANSAGNDLITQRPGFPGLKEGCRWCLCVERWKEALTASARLGERVVPK